MGRNIDEKFQIAKWEIDLIGKKKKKTQISPTNKKEGQTEEKKKDLSVSGMKIQLAVRFLLLY